MADLQGVKIQKGNIGANTILGGDAISGFISTGVATSKLALDTSTVFYTLNDVENIGINQEYDTANSVNVYRHLSEFYRIAPEGTALYLMLTDGALTMSEVCEKAKKLIPFAKGKIRQLAISVNPVTAPVMLNGIAKEVYDTIPVAQGIAEWAFDNNMPLQILLEGFSFSGNAAATQDLREIPNVKANKVSVFVGQDYNYAKTLTGQKQRFADVGSLLGLTARALVNQNVGNNNDPSFNLTDATSNSWLEPALSSGQTNDSIFESLQTLEDKGFLFGVEYSGLAGVRVNNDHTCTPIIKDKDNSTNEHTITLGRVNDKAIRGLRIAYLPYVKTDWALDVATGKLPPAVVRALEDVGNRVFEDMVLRNEISFGEVKVDKDSDLLIQKSLLISFKIVPRGVIGEIKGTINLKTQI